MITFQESAMISAPVEKVFAYIADPDQIPNWRKDVPGISQLSGATGVGTTFCEEVNFMGKKQLLMKVTEYSPNKKLVIEAQCPCFRPNPFHFQVRGTTPKSI